MAASLCRLLLLNLKQLQYEYVPVDQQTITGEFNIWLTLMMPLALMLLISTARRSLKEAHFAALGIISGYILNDLVTSWSRSSRERCPTDGVPLRLHQRARWSIQARFLFSLSMGCNSRDLHWYSSSDTRRKEKFPIRSFIICVLWLRLPSSFPCGEE